MKKVKIKVKKKNKIDLDDYRINDYTKKGLFSSLFSGISLLKYKFAIYWLPLLFFIPLIYIYTVTILGKTSIQNEIIASFVSGLLIFIIYIIIDLIYQNIVCKNSTFIILLLNSLNNALIPSIFVIIGYLLGIFFLDKKVLSAAGALKNDGVIEYTEVSKIKKSLLENKHINNIALCAIFYVLSIFYNNPINRSKCSNIRICN